MLDLLEDAKAGRPLRGPSPQSAAAAAASPLSPSSTQALLRDSSSLATPPLSPQKGAATSARDARLAHVALARAPPRDAAQADHAAGRRARSPSKAAPAAAAAPEAGDSFAAIPRFYRGAEAEAWPAAESAEKLQLAARLFGGEERALDVEQFRAVAREVCELPGFFAPLLMHRVHGTDPMEAAASGSGSMSAPARAPAPVTLAQFRAYWDATLRKYARDEARAFHVLRGDRVVDADAAAAPRHDAVPRARGLPRRAARASGEPPRFGVSEGLARVPGPVPGDGDVPDLLRGEPGVNGKLTKREFLRSDLARHARARMRRRT